MNLGIYFVFSKQYSTFPHFTLVIPQGQCYYYYIFLYGQIGKEIAQIFGCILIGSLCYIHSTVVVLCNFSLKYILYGLETQFKTPPLRFTSIINSKQNSYNFLSNKTNENRAHHCICNIKSLEDDAKFYTQYQCILRNQMLLCFIFIAALLCSFTALEFSFELG